MKQKSMLFQIVIGVYIHPGVHIYPITYLCVSQSTQEATPPHTTHTCRTCRTMQNLQNMDGFLCQKGERQRDSSCSGPLQLFCRCSVNPIHDDGMSYEAYFTLAQWQTLETYLHSNFYQPNGYGLETRDLHTNFINPMELQRLETCITNFRVGTNPNGMVDRDQRLAYKLQGWYQPKWYGRETRDLHTNFTSSTQ